MKRLSNDLINSVFQREELDDGLPGLVRTLLKSEKGIDALHIHRTGATRDGAKAGSYLSIDGLDDTFVMMVWVMELPRTIWIKREPERGWVASMSGVDVPSIEVGTLTSPWPTISHLAEVEDVLTPSEISVQIQMASLIARSEGR
ncbi:hypothetical protein JT358_16810 [Micrococcales bacterium 31B]|nr:hypothetical protein [Micrococcales bacterium 31B]